MSKPKPFPGPAAFFVEGSLYVRYQLDQQKEPDDENLLDTFEGPLDCYCIGCGRESVYHQLVSRGGGSGGGYGSRFLPPRLTERHFFCTRSNKHEIVIFYLRGNQSPDRSAEELKEDLRKAEAGEPLTGTEQIRFAMKVGQWPSLADLSSERVGRYRAVLSEKQYGEFNRGVGLHAHDVGIGSFVYLRRIFEDLVEEAHAKAKVDAAWDEDVFLRNQHRMEDQIKLLSAHLPRTLVENRALYSILSEGIHDLEEEECAALFPVVRNAIEMILDEKIAEREKTRREKETKRAIEDAKAKLGGKLTT